jgi:anaphase-promoting complex subunit 5
VLVAPEGAGVDAVFLDPNSQLGVFLRCCILAFNSMTFEVQLVIYM